jgi:U4/U6.U5 tri-snRNP-associated protein 1
LALLKTKAVQEEKLDSVIGRKTDKLHDVDIRDPAPKIRLDHVDEYGRKLTPKEAFRQMSHKFHGKKPGKNKQEKRIKQIKEEMKRKGMSAVDTPLNTVFAMKQVMEEMMKD